MCLDSWPLARWPSMRCHVSASVYRQVDFVIFTFNISTPLHGDSEKGRFSVYFFLRGFFWQLKYAICSGWHVSAAVFGVELPWPLWVKHHIIFLILISTYSKNIFHKTKHKFAPFYCTKLIFSLSKWCLLLFLLMVRSQVIGYNSLLVSQLQKEDNPDLVFTFELASWICQSFNYLQNQSIKISEISRQSCCSASLWAMASVAGCLLGSVLSDFLGRRKALMVWSFCQI